MATISPGQKKDLIGDVVTLTVGGGLDICDSRAPAPANADVPQAVTRVRGWRVRGPVEQVGYEGVGVSV